MRGRVLVAVAVVAVAVLALLGGRQLRVRQAHALSPRVTAAAAVVDSGPQCPTPPADIAVAAGPSLDSALGLAPRDSAGQCVVTPAAGNAAGR